MMTSIILGPSYRVRYLDSNKSYPVSLKKVCGEESALDWNVAALKKAGIANVSYIGGYHLEKVVQQHPDLHYLFHANWEKEGTLGALVFAGEILGNGGLIVDGGVLLRYEAVAGVMCEKADIVLGVDYAAREDIAGDSQELLVRPNGVERPFRFAGIIKCSAKGANLLIREAADLLNDGKVVELHHLVSALANSGVQLQLVDVENNWSPLDQPMALAQFVLGSKAQTLERLQPLLKTATILDQVSFTVKDWQTSPESIIGKVNTSLKADSLIVRSSALVEDAWTSSNAGRFESVLDVDAGSSELIHKAINRVVSSYRKNGAEDGLNQIFVQPFVSSVVMSGVLFTRDIETYAPYYVINYHLTDRTDTVTAGHGEELKTLIVYKKDGYAYLDGDLRALIEVAREVELLTGHHALDVEFAVNKDGHIYVLQVRPIATKKRYFVPTDDDFELELKEAREFVAQIFRPNPNLLGDSSLLSNMSDWNPAEMIGANPRPLALSLYQYLITDKVWGQARADIGYRDTFPSPLLVVVSGQPFIDLRTSFNSFIPESLSEGVAEKCVDGYMAYLSMHPEYYDKIEFKVAFTCFTFDFDHHTGRLERMGLAPLEIEELKLALLRQTDGIIKGDIGPVSQQLEALKTMEQRRNKLLNAAGNRIALPAKIRQLLDDCARYGTLPFSILARYGFIALSILQSLQHRGILTQEEYEKCLHIPTIATEISNAMEDVLERRMLQEKFLEKYGHLRPGTYDILSPNYRQAPHIYLNFESSDSKSKRLNTEGSVAWDLLESKFPQIDTLLKENGFDCSPSQLRDFIFAAVSGREYAKFEFTKSVNLALEWILEMGSLWELDVDQLSYLNIHDILKWATDSQHSAIYNRLKRAISFEQKRHELNCSVKLSHLIRSPRDIDCFELLECKPNFVTSKIVNGEVAFIEEHGGARKVLEGKIVVIKNADPGFDWIFMHGIAGLVTQYGGMASHMAIRAAEFGLPAAIGCGEILFKRVASARVITLDCVGQQIKIVN